MQFNVGISIENGINCDRTTLGWLATIDQGRVEVAQNAARIGLGLYVYRYSQTL